MSVDFVDFALAHLPAAPARVLEVGCGSEGGVTPALAQRGYEALGIDPRAPEGPLFRQVALEELEGTEAFDAVVAGRVLHHVDPLGPALDKLAGLAPLLIVDEFAWNHIDAPTEDWYEGQHRMLRAAGAGPKGPASIEEWRWRHADLHPYEPLRAEIDARYEERAFVRRPYLYRWLGGPATESLEQALVDAGAVRPLGWMYAGTRR
jgi:hypothetical protein